MRLSLVCIALLAGCEPELLNATFTSRIVQHDTCKIVGDRAEVCTEEEALTDLRVRIVEKDDDNIWLYGITRGGVSDRALLGTRDADDGFLFVDEVVQSNALNGCSLTDRVEISLAIDSEVAVESIGSDPCVSLLGRETEVTISSPGCDSINVPQAQTALTQRRRWERSLECATLGE